MICRSVSCILGVIYLSFVAEAGVITSVETDKAPDGAEVGAPYDPVFPAGGPSSIDLLQGLLPTVAVGDFQRENSAGVAALTDGTVLTYYGTGTAESNHSAYATAGDNESVVYVLPVAHNLSSIVIFGGWNDAGRDAQHYNLLTSTDGITFDLLGSIDINPGIQGTDITPVSNRVAFTEDTLPYLALDVTHIRVNFLAVENGYTGYTEIDVFGTPVPEPASIILACASMLSMVVLCRRML